jgi:hypothetical protein
MKKAARILLTLMLICSLCACEKTGESSDKTFAARISLASANSLTVTPDVTTSEYKASDTIVVALAGDTVLTDTDGNAIDLSFLTTGTEVEIAYNGTIEESYPARITARAVRLRNGVVSGTTPSAKENSITFTMEGQSETVAADKVTLGNFTILVPADGWKSSSAEDTKVGPLIISPESNKDVSLTFRVHKNTDIEDVKALILKRNLGFSWESWDKAVGASAAFTAWETSNGAYYAAFAAQFGEDTVSILCRCPEDMQEGYGVRLSQIAATLAISS